MRKGQGTGPKEEVGQVLYMRGAMSAMLGVEGIRAAQERFGKGKVMTGEQVRWGLENLNLTQAKLDALGFAGVMRPISTSCTDHMGASWARIHTWDGKQWKFTSDWLQARRADHQAAGRATAAKYAADKKLTARDAGRLPVVMCLSSRACTIHCRIDRDRWLPGVSYDRLPPRE